MTDQHGRCPGGQLHDWVVSDMRAEADMRAFYHIECDRCGAIDSGNADEIPAARFK